MPKISQYCYAYLALYCHTDNARLKSCAHCCYSSLFHNQNCNMPNIVIKITLVYSPKLGGR